MFYTDGLGVGVGESGYKISNVIVSDAPELPH
jgi:hypothetical protein